MELDVFTSKVREAARVLLGLCSDGEPSEEEVLEATKGVGLHVFANSKSFVGDPVRFAVFVEAYQPRVRPGVTVDQVIEKAWEWHEKLVETPA